MCDCSRFERAQRLAVLLTAAVRIAITRLQSGASLLGLPSSPTDQPSPGRTLSSKFRLFASAPCYGADKLNSAETWVEPKSSADASGADETDLTRGRTLRRVLVNAPALALANSAPRRRCGRGVRHHRYVAVIILTRAISSPQSKRLHANKRRKVHWLGSEIKFGTGVGTK